MHKRINVTLPEETVALIDRVTEKGDRSSLIDHAVRHYIEDLGKKNLRRRLKEGAIKRAERDHTLAEEWFTLDEEAWQKSRK
jgi:CopG family transcriptional regulator / antitoxin EndoAI